jgi:transcription elongation factor Elf1
MTIKFIYYYTLVCAKCGNKIADNITPVAEGSSGHIFTINSNSCGSCGETKEFNVISSVAKVFKE